MYEINLYGVRGYNITPILVNVKRDMAFGLYSGIYPVPILLIFALAGLT